MMKSLMFSLLLAVGAAAATAPGVKVEMLGSTAGFATSIAVDSRGAIYYTTTAGGVFRFENGQSKQVASVTTDAVGDSGLLGMALLDDHTAVVHYTTPRQTADVISTIDLDTGVETELHSFVADISSPGRETPAEHHGGNPSVAADGTIFVAIGDYGGGLIASLPEWNGGKVWRVFPDGHAEQFARGLRNPFDLSYDVVRQRLFLPDNGAAVDDELNVITTGANCGWPFTAGKGPSVDGATAPVYVFPRIIAPTGLVALSGRNPMLRSGYLIGSFVAKAIYWIPDVDVTPLPDPIPVVERETGFIIDVTERADGEIFFVTGNAVYHLTVPTPRMRPLRRR
jgi:glucose/arabinose dehydrogenase